MAPKKTETKKPAPVRSRAPDPAPTRKPQLPVPARRTAATPATRAQSTSPALPGNLAALAAQDSGAGMEGADRDAFAIPFIRIIQDGSPQVKIGKPQYNPDAEPGMLVNTVTGELYPGEDGIIFVPCAFQHRFIQWAPRGAEGGYRGEWLPEEVKEKLADGTFVRGDDNVIYVGEANEKKSDRIVDTRSHFGLIISEDGSVSQALLALSSTQIKKSKQLMGILSAIRLNGQTPPTWLSKIRITVPAEQESNDSGSWYGIRVEHVGFIEDESTYDLGKAFHDTIAAGRGKVNYDGMDDSAEQENGKF